MVNKTSSYLYFPKHTKSKLKFKVLDKALALSNDWNRLMRPHDMKYIGFKHQRENNKIAIKIHFTVYSFAKKYRDLTKMY